MKIEQIERCGRYRGRKELLAHMAGKRLTGKQASWAKCFECMGGFADGAYDCNIPDCPLHPRMPYRGVLAPQYPQNDPIQPPKSGETGIVVGG